MKTRFLTFLYFFTGTLFILNSYLPLNLPGIVIKSLIIPVLLILFITHSGFTRKGSDLIIVAGLIFSWMGDVILELPGGSDYFFIAGLASFLLAHVMYIIVFLRTKGENIVFKKKQYLIIPVLIYGVVLGFWLWSGLGAMKIPVIIYTLVILTMVTAAINRLEKVNRLSYFLVLGGAILFTLSDSAIAINKFGSHFANSEIVVMSTYITAQFLIVNGYIKAVKSK